MTKDEARKAAEVMLAYANGNIIEWSRKDRDDWMITDDPIFDWICNDYRFRHKPKYSPFNSTEECWGEMKKHEPFGWIKEKNSNFKMCILSLDNDGVLVGDYEDGKVFISYEAIFKHHTFVDDSPIGIKEE